MQKRTIVFGADFVGWRQEFRVRYSSMGRRRRDARRCVVLEGSVLAVLIRLTWCCGDILLKTFLFLFLSMQICFSAAQAMHTWCYLPHGCDIREVMIKEESLLLFRWRQVVDVSGRANMARRNQKLQKSKHSVGVTFEPHPLRACHDVFQIFALGVPAQNLLVQRWQWQQRGGCDNRERRE